MAGHICDICRPYHERYERLKRAERPRSTAWDNIDIQLAEMSLNVVRKLICSDSPPDLPPEFQPLGPQRKEFLRRRVMAKCPPCQRIADEYTIHAMREREHRAHEQQVKLEGTPLERGYVAEVMSRMEDQLEELLRYCEQVKCRRKGDEGRAAGALLDAIGDYAPPPQERGPEPGGNAAEESGTGDREASKSADKAVEKKVGAGAAIRSPWVFWFFFLLALAAGGGWWLFGDNDTTVDASQEATGGLDFAQTDAGTAIVEAALAFGADPDTTLSCVSNGMGLRNTTDAEYEAMQDSDVSTWPSGLAERYAQVLEDCVQLRPYYLELFGQYEYLAANCPTIMTDHVLESYSWLRFLNEGILDADLRPGIQSDFNRFVDAGYLLKGCLAATPDSG